MSARWVKYWHTLRHLRFAQWYGRARLWLARPRVDLRPAPPVRSVDVDHWVLPAQRRPSLVGAQRFCFLNETRELAAHGWDDPALGKLWRYNLHYFDDLSAYDARRRRDWHCALLGRWVVANPPADGTGWEAYPTSLRIVNWIKWALAGNPLPPSWLDSLAVQTRWLAARLEYHLLANHLLANAKALIFAGVYFDGPEASRWLSLGLAIMERQLPEQVLADGGHFELSPMYHSLVLEDLLDLSNVGRLLRDAAPARWPAAMASWWSASQRMRAWLLAMCHPDGELSFFNDAARGIAPSPIELERYAGRLGLPPVSAPADGVTQLRDSGYVRVQQGEMVALLDMGPIGPDYQPGHAHADTLSFELSLFGKRVLVNSGTSRYDVGPARHRERGTAAHNTVVVNGLDSSETWHSFRVARRARPLGAGVKQELGAVVASCAHDGYCRLKGRPVHRREWRFSGAGLRVTDSLDGRFETAVVHWHLAPGLSAPTSGHMTTPLGNGHELTWKFANADVVVQEDRHHPEFGLELATEQIVATMRSPSCAVDLQWR